MATIRLSPETKKQLKEMQKTFEFGSMDKTVKELINLAKMQLIERMKKQHIEGIIIE